MTQTERSEIVIAEINVDMDTGRAVEVGPLARDGATAAYRMAGRYLEIAARLLEDAPTTLHIAYDPGLLAQQGGSGRFIVVAGTSKQFADIVSKALNKPIGRHDTIVVLGPDFADWDVDDDRLVDVIAADLTVVFDVLYPIECQGPIKTMMPFLVQIAGNIIIPGTAEGAVVGKPGTEGAVDILEDRKEKAISRAFRAFSERLYGVNGGYGRLVTDHPDWMMVANEVGNEAILMAKQVRPPMSRNHLVMGIHEVIAQAMRNIGIPVVPKQPVSAF